MLEGIRSQTRNCPWYREINAYQWRTLILAILGYTLDAMDFLMYALVMGLIMKEFAISGATAGFIATVVLIAASAGGYIFGVLTDYIGRARYSGLHRHYLLCGHFRFGLFSQLGRIASVAVPVGFGYGRRMGARYSLGGGNLAGKTSRQSPGNGSMLMGIRMASCIGGFHISRSVLGVARTLHGWHSTRDHRFYRPVALGRT